jgi:hypothetical protein
VRVALVESSDQRGTVGVGAGEHIEQFGSAGLSDGGDDPAAISSWSPTGPRDPLGDLTTAEQRVAALAQLRQLNRLPPTT